MRNWNFWLTLSMLVVVGFQTYILHQTRLDVTSSSDATQKQTGDLVNASRDFAKSSWTAASNIGGVSNQAKESLSASIKQGRDSLKQSQDALNQTIEMSRNDQRAWVGPLRPEYAPQIKEGFPVAATTRIRNFGKTPARNVVVTAACNVQPGVKDFNSTIASIAVYPFLSSDVLFPGGEIVVSPGEIWRIQRRRSEHN